MVGLAGSEAGELRPGSLRAEEVRHPAPPRLCSPCQLRRASERRDSPEGARGGCSRNRRGPDTSSESRAVKNVAEGTSGHEHQKRLAGPEAAMAARPSRVPPRHSPPPSAISASLRRFPLATAEAWPRLKPRPLGGMPNPVESSTLTRPKEAGTVVPAHPQGLRRLPPQEYSCPDFRFFLLHL